MRNDPEHGLLGRRQPGCPRRSVAGHRQPARRGGAREWLSAVAIPTRSLGQTGPEVTVLGYGAMELRGEPSGPALTDADAGRLLNAVLDEGITLIDTAIDYGRSEELIGAT
jgi:Aldo/keto reductase family